jgi:muramoyltetrapeptide carboxypeptidase
MDPKAAAVILARGGYGLLRLLDRITLEGLQRRPKPIVGFSDGTLLLAMAAQAGLTTIHGPVVTQLGTLPAHDFSALVHLLEDPEPGVLLEGLKSLTPGRAEGSLLGGNLEVFSRLIGTPFLPDLKGAILLIEDVGERPYRLDRLLTHLTLAGIFQQVSAVLVGDFIACEEPAPSRTPFPTAEDVVCERLARLTIPVALGAPVGHGMRNRALPYGAHVVLDTQAGTLTALTGVVR